jgi:SAM-dependent methyltransferase
MERTTCRSCGSGDLTRVLSLGEQYVSDFVDPGKEKDGLLIPIELDLCGDCTLVQARRTPPPDQLYKKHYWYRSGVTDTMRAALKDVADSALARVTLESGDVVLDIGSNDGTLLRAYGNIPAQTVGYEPADNLQEEGSRGVDVLIHDFWNKEAYWGLGRQPKAKIVTACGMFYDLDDPNQFVADIAAVLANDGIFVAQLMLLRDMMEGYDLGNFSHEHLEFYSLRSLQALFYRHGMMIGSVERNSVNGGSHRLYVRKSRIEYYSREVAEDLWRRDDVYTDPATYAEWQEEMDANARRLRLIVEGFKAEGKRVWVYGASTKGNVILQHAKLDYPLIEGAAERSPEKWGKVTVGTGIPIYSEQYARERADYFLVLPYAFLPEFMEREREWRDRGGRFIVPLPYVRIV